jgi:ribosome-associated toxin RatA of RatAB toxin-antitoxin module
VLYQAEKEVDVQAPPEVFLDLVWDFERYPSFVTGISATRMLRKDARTSQVEVTAKLMGIPFRYVLDCVREENRVRWARTSGAFSLAEGSWTLVKEQDGRFRYRYENTVDPGVPVPGFIIQYVLDTSLPKLVQEFRAEAESMARARARDAREKKPS